MIFCAMLHRVDLHVHAYLCSVLKIWAFISYVGLRGETHQSQIILLAKNVNMLLAGRLF